MDNVTTAENITKGVTKGVEEVKSLGQGSVQAVLRSSEILNNGFQTISKMMADSAQSQLDLNITTCKAMSDVKSVKDAMALQSSHVRMSFEKFFAEAGKFNEAAAKLAEESMAPIKAQMARSAEKFALSLA